jgi:hypothetical protein
VSRTRASSPGQGFLNFTGGADQQRDTAGHVFQSMSLLHCAQNACGLCFLSSLRHVRFNLWYGGATNDVLHCIVHGCNYSRSLVVYCCSLGNGGVDTHAPHGCFVN